MRKEGALEDARKYESKARKCRRKYDELVEQLREMLEIESIEMETQTESFESPKLRTGMGRVKRGGRGQYANMGNREPVQEGYF